MGEENRENLSHLRPDTADTRDGLVSRGGMSDISVAPSEAPSTQPMMPMISEKPVIVDWEGPDDPEKPLNWPKNTKTMIISAVCLMRFTTYAYRPRPSR